MYNHSVHGNSAKQWYDWVRLAVRNGFWLAETSTATFNVSSSCAYTTMVHRHFCSSEGTVSSFWPLTMPHALQCRFRRMALNSPAHNIHIVTSVPWMRTGARVPREARSVCVCLGPGNMDKECEHLLYTVQNTPTPQWTVRLKLCVRWIW